MILYWSAIFPLAILTLVLFTAGNAYAAVITDLRVVHIDEHRAVLAWTAPTTTPDNPIIDYQISYKKEVDSDFTIFNDGVSASTGADITGLIQGTKYVFKVKAIKDHGSVNSQNAYAQTRLINPIHISPPKISGVGFYTILLSSDNPYLESGSYARKINTKFEDYFPYSTFSDKIDKENFATDYEKKGQYFYTDEYSTSVPTLFGKVGQPIQIQVRVVDPLGTNVSHVSIYTNVRDNYSDKQFSAAYVIYDGAGGAQVFDSNGLFKDVKVNTSLENGEFWVILDFVFAKPMEKSDILLESWNEGRTPVYKKIANAWQIDEPKQTQLQESIPLNAHVTITHDASSPVCGGDHSCFAPYETLLKKGGTVTWTNTDSFIHTVTSGTPEKEENIFDSFVMPGASYQYTFDKSGNYPYFCEIHPWAIGLVSVSDGITTTKKSVPTDMLIVYAKTPQGSLMIQNDDEVYLENHSVKIEISGNIVRETNAKYVDLLIKRPDRSFEKIKTYVNNDGYYKTLTILDDKWQSGSYTIVAQYQKKIIGSVSFVLAE